jgi:hypothetical protein
MMDNACPFLEEMYDWNKKQILQFITDNSSNDFLNIKFTWQELGLSEEWYLKECRSLNNNLLIIRREIDLEWTKASDNSVFKEETLDKIFKILKPSIGTAFLQPKRDAEDIEGILKENYVIKIYKELIPNKVYFVGCDVGGGTQNDYSAFVVIDPDNMDICAVFRNNKINTSIFSSLLISLIENVIPNAYLFIEDNSLGLGVIGQLLRRIPTRLFYDYKLPDKDKKKLIHKTPNNIKYGVHTDATSRSLMIDILFEVTDANYSELAYPELYDELKTLVYSKNGKVEHDTNAHDDILFAYLMVKYAIRYSNNINKFLRDSSIISTNIKKVSSKNIDGLDTSVVNPNETKSEFSQIKGLDLEEYVKLALEGMSSKDIANVLSNKKQTERTINKNMLSILSDLNK